MTSFCVKSQLLIKIFFLEPFCLVSTCFGFILINIIWVYTLNFLRLTCTVWHDVGRFTECQFSILISQRCKASWKHQCIYGRWLAHQFYRVFLDNDILKKVPYIFNNINLFSDLHRYFLPCTSNSKNIFEN